jgi:hypothetical protein
MKETDLAYAAGIIDGEGCIYASKPSKHNSYRLNVAVSMTSERVVRLMAELFGGPVYDGNKIKRELVGRKQIWTWRVTNESAVAVLRLIGPYLVEKGDQAWLGLSWPAGKKGVKLPSEVSELRRELYFALSEIKE